jgi:uncharacterized membrane protein
MAKREVVTRRTAVVSGETIGRSTEQTITLYDNILPSPEELSAYKEISTSLVEMVIETTLDEQKQRHAAEKKKLEIISRNESRKFKKSMLGLICAFIIMLGGIAASTYLIHAGKDIAGTIFAGVTILAVVRMCLSHSKK